MLMHNHIAMIKNTYNTIQFALFLELKCEEFKNLQSRIYSDEVIK